MARLGHISFFGIAFINLAYGVNQDLTEVHPPPNKISILPDHFCTVHDECCCSYFNLALIFNGKGKVRSWSGFAFSNWCFSFILLVT